MQEAPTTAGRPDPSARHCSACKTIAAHTDVPHMVGSQHAAKRHSTHLKTWGWTSDGWPELEQAYRVMTCRHPHIVTTAPGSAQHTITSRMAAAMHAATFGAAVSAS
jgi:hypothetical protein